MRRLLAPAAVLLALAPAVPADAALRFERCGGYGYRCAKLSVPLDRSGVVPGRLRLHVQRVPARRRPSRGAVFVLAGGPGQSASAAFGGDALGVLYPAYRDRDLIVFDQRGTGRSGALRCGPLDRSNLLDAGDEAAACAARLGARRAFFTSRDSVSDIEAIRAALGYRQISLFGTSYGTKVALGYALTHPQRVERLVLDSVVEATGPDPFYLPSQEAAPRALRSLCRSGCGSFTADPVADLQGLVARLAAGPLRGRLVDRLGRRRPASLDRTDLFTILIAGDFDPTLRAAFPGAVRAALDGDPAGLLRLARRAFAVEGPAPPPRLLSSTLYAATTCEDIAFPWPRSTPPDPAQRASLAAAAAASLPDMAFQPFDRPTALANDLLRLCERWPTAAAAPAFGPGPLPDVPVLLLEGEDDLRTPVEGARRVAAQFPQSTLVVAPATGHSALGSDRSRCADRAFARFFAGRRVAGRCPRVRREFRVLPPPPTELSEVEPVSGVSGARGRVLAALGMTLRDVSDDVLTQLIFDPRDPDIARGGGLRAGHYRVDGDAELTMSGVVFVPGVTVSGRLRRFDSRRPRGTVRISGPAGPGGRLRVVGVEVSGSLGGRRVHARLGGRASAAQVRAARSPLALR